LVSEAIAPAVAVPLDDAPNAGVAHTSVAAAVPGAPIVPPTLNTSFEPAPSSKSTTAFVAASLAVVLCVTAIVCFL